LPSLSRFALLLLSRTQRRFLLEWLANTSHARRRYDAFATVYCLTPDEIKIVEGTTE